MLFPLLYKLLAAAGIAGMLVAGAYFKGRSDANANCRAAALQAQVEALKRDIKVQLEADAYEAAQMIELETENDKKDMEIAEYVKKLAERPTDSRCLLDDLDIGVDRMRAFGPR